MTRAQLESDGFICLQDFFEEEFMQEVEATVARYVEAVVPGPPAGRVLREAKGEAVKSMSSMDREDDFFARLNRHLRMDMKARARVKPETAKLPGKEARL